MSGWQAYISTLLELSPTIERAAVINFDGLICARTEGPKDFKITNEEMKKFVSLFEELVDVPSVGVDLEDIHYIVPYTEENLIFGKKEKNGFFAAKTKTVIIIAFYEGNFEASAQVRDAVEKVAHYLVGIGY